MMSSSGYPPCNRKKKNNNNAICCSSWSFILICLTQAYAKFGTFITKLTIFVNAAAAIDKQ